MPLVLFFVTLLTSLTLVLSTFGVVKRAQVRQASLAQDAAFLASESSLGQAWSDIVPESAASSVSRLEEYSAGLSLELAFNQGIPVLEESTLLEDFSDEKPLELFERSAEISLIDVDTGEAVSGVGIDLCKDSEPCPELVLEWFRFDKYFRFQDLSFLDASSFDDDLNDGCVDLPAVGVQRCVIHSSSLSFPSDLQRLDADSEYSQRWRLRSSLASYDYIVRVWLQSADPVWMRFSGLENSPDADLVALPQQVYAAESKNSAVFSRAYSQESRRISAGLQDGLSFVHYADEIEDK